MLVFRPLGDRVVVKPADPIEKTAGGVFIPETAGREKPMEGTVIAVGPGKVTFEGVKIPTELKVGDKVIFSKYAGTEAVLNGIVHLMLREDDILAVVCEYEDVELIKEVIDENNKGN